MVTNTGDETLVISNVIPSCGCTTVGGSQPAAASGGGTASTPATWTHEIAPGQTGVIPIQIFTSSLRGAIAKDVQVVSNDKARPIVNLEIHGQVWLPIELVPSLVSFTLTPGATNPNSQAVKIFNRTDAPLELSDPQSTTNVFSLVLKTNIPGREFELTVTALPPADLRPSLNSVLIQGEFSLKCSMTNKNPLTIPVLASVPAQIAIFPSSILLPVGPLNQPSISRITIRESITNFTLSNPAASVPGVDVSLATLQTNRTYVLSVVFPRDFVARPDQHVTVKTDNPRFPTITIPITPSWAWRNRRGPPSRLPPPGPVLPAPANPSNTASAGSVGSTARLPATPIATITQGANPTRLPVPPGAALANASNSPPLPPMPSMPPSPENCEL